MKINTKSFFNYYIIHPFSKRLPPSDQAVAALASAFFLVLTLGALHGHAYLKGKKVTPQAQSHVQPKTEPKIISLPQKPRPPKDLQLLKFEAQINQMGSHILPYQRQTLLSLFKRASRSENFYAALEQGIDEKINQPDGWGREKALHLKKNLLSNSTQKPSSPVAKIANQPIDAQGNKLVCFYKTGITEFLGNFANCPHGVNLWGRRFKCSEAAFQWRKYQLAGIQDPKMNEFFQANGEQAFRLNRHFEQAYPATFASGWRNGVRDQVMWDVLNAKFAQNPEFKRLLDETKGAYLLEHNQATRDNYWSDNHDGSGKNMLGKMLMALRDGHPKPPVDDTSDAAKVRYFAHYANQKNYSIF